MERTRPPQVAPLPITVRVIVRDWLNSNSIVLLQRDHNVVVDTGYSSQAQQTLGLLREPEHLGDSALHLVINTIVIATTWAVTRSLRAPTPVRWPFPSAKRR